jgi:hypothetical protein
MKNQHVYLVVDISDLSILTVESSRLDARLHRRDFIDYGGFPQKNVKIYRTTSEKLLRGAVVTW